MPGSILDPEVKSSLERARVGEFRELAIGGEIATFSAPFSSPADWRDVWIYFLLLDRFNNPTSAPNDVSWNEFQGGTFNGVRERLDYLRDLGVGAIWLSPVQKNCQYRSGSYHGYGVQDFLAIEPRFSSNPALARDNPTFVEAELRALVDAAHARGMYVIFDVVLNHAGDVFGYVVDGSDSPWDEADWRDAGYAIRWRDHDGDARLDWPSAPSDVHVDAAVRPIELARGDYFRRMGKGGEAGGDFYSLKEFITDYRARDENGRVYFPVRNILISAYQYMVAKFDPDGFRIDTLKYVEPEFAHTFGNAMREFALSIGKRDFFTFGEIMDGEEKIASFIGKNTEKGSDIIGVDAALDFPLAGALGDVIKGRTAPAAIAALYDHRKEVQKKTLSSHGEASRYFVTFLDNHDEKARFYYRDPQDPQRFDDQLTLALGCLFGLQGIPCIYYGTEQGLHGSGSDVAVREPLWNLPGAFDTSHRFYRALRGLSDLRNSEPALRYGRQYFRPVSGDSTHFGVSNLPEGILAFSRILNDREVVVVANTNSSEGWSGQVLVDLGLNPDGIASTILYSNLWFSERAGHRRTVGVATAKRGEGQVEVVEPDGSRTFGPVRYLEVSLERMEVQVLRVG